MRPRDVLSELCIRRSWSSYHPHSLIWQYSCIGDVHAFAKQARLSEHSLQPQLPWRQLIPATFYDFWLQFMNVMFNGDSSNDQKDVAISRVLPLFHNPNLQVPFRLMTVHETAVISGVHDTLNKACQPNCSAAYLIDDEIILSVAGNSFHPKLISAALGTKKRRT